MVSIAHFISSSYVCPSDSLTYDFDTAGFCDKCYNFFTIHKLLVNQLRLACLLPGGHYEA